MNYNASTNTHSNSAGILRRLCFRTSTVSAQSVSTTFRETWSPSATTPLRPQCKMREIVVVTFESIRYDIPSRNPQPNTQDRVRGEEERRAGARALRHVRRLRAKASPGLRPPPSKHLEERVSERKPLISLSVISSFNTCYM